MSSEEAPRYARRVTVPRHPELMLAEVLGNQSSQRRHVSAMASAGRLHVRAESRNRNPHRQPQSEKKSRFGIAERPKSREETPKKGMQGIAASQGGIWQCDMDFARGASAEFCTSGQNLHEDCQRVMCTIAYYPGTMHDGIAPAGQGAAQ